MSNSIKDFSEKIKNAIPNFKDVYKMTIILPSKIEITRHDKGNIYDMVDDPLFGKGLSIQDTNF